MQVLQARAQSANSVTQPCEIWPETQAALQLFSRVSTQWRTGPGGIIGLDYSAPPIAKLMQGRVSRKRRQLLADLQTLEAEILLLWAASMN